MSLLRLWLAFSRELGTFRTPSIIETAFFTGSPPLEDVRGVGIISKSFVFVLFLNNNTHNNQPLTNGFFTSTCTLHVERRFAVQGY